MERVWFPSWLCYYFLGTSDEVDFMRHCSGRMLLTVAAIMNGAGIELAEANAKERGFYGSFEFAWLAEPVGQHRNMRLLSEVSFVDASGKEWGVPAGTVVDGATIPPAMWSVAGSPFTGNYRRASVIHDHYCETVTTGAEPVHRLFLDAMLLDGVPSAEANSKYVAVKLYSFDGGKCGVAKTALTEFQTGPVRDRVVKSEELDAFLSSDNIMKEFNLPGEVTAAARVESVARLEAPRTFDAIVQYSRNPNEQTLKAIEEAVSAESPTTEQLETLTTLAGATAEAIERSGEN
jgi:hypothetical protein